MAENSAQLQLAVLMFTDIVNSVSLQKKLGTAAYTRYISRHDEIFKACLQQAPGGRILNETGDGFLVRMNSSSDAVNTALRLQYRLHNEICEGEPMAVRIGLHSGEITEMQEGLRGETRAVGMAINLAARIMDLAAEGQILMTRAVFDDARQFTRSYPEIDGIDSAELPPLLWPAYGRYIFKGNDEPMEIYGVGAEGITPLVRPEGSEKAKRAVAADEEATLGWRPGAGLAIPRREDWVIEKKIGDGGFGEVWLAENKKSRMQRVFKFCFDPDRLRSFKRELTLFRLLQDALGNRRDIAALYEVSVESPPYYLESEYVPTGNISQWFASKGGIENIPLATRLQIMAKAARAAAAAHSVGIIHKDIKPSNILISEENGIPEPRLADFGIGALADTSRLGSMGITSNGFTESVILESEGSQSFTHLYAPPEYLVGKPASVRGDIYSLGVMLYQLAVGDLNSPLGTGWRRSIPDSLLADDIRRCVDVDPERRFQSASHLAEHLEQLDSRHAEQQEEFRIEGLKQNARRRKRTMVLTMSISCGLALLTALLAKGYIEQRQAKDDAIFQRQQATEATEKLSKQASYSDFRLAGQLLARDRRSEALVYLARSIERDPHNLPAGRKLMATLAMSRFLPLKLPPIETQGRKDDRPFTKAFSHDGLQLAALFNGEEGEELRVWNFADSVIASEQLAWESTAPSERVLDIAFASNQTLCFITQGADRTTTLHIWEKTPKWVWVRSEPVGETNGFSGFIANGSVWVREQRMEPGGGRRGPHGVPSQFVFHYLLTGESFSLPTPRGRVRQLEGFVTEGKLSSAIAIHEMSPNDRTVSIWNNSDKGKPEVTEPDPTLESDAPDVRPPGRRQENDLLWRSCSRGSSWSAGPPVAIAISPDGQYAAVPESEGPVNVWPLTLAAEGTPEPVRTIHKANDVVTSLRFSPDSQRIAIGYFGGSAFLYNAKQSGSPVGPFEHEGGIIGIEISEDGAKLLTRSLDQTARLWNTSNGVSLSEPMRHDSYVLSGSLSSVGNLAVTIDTNGITKVWNLAGGPAQGEGLPFRNGHHFSAISSDWKTLFTTSATSVAPGYQEYQGHLKSWQRVIKGKPVAPGARISGSRFTDDGTHLIVVRVDGTINVRNIETGNDQTFHLDSTQDIQLRAISGDGSTIAIVTQDRSQRPAPNYLSVWRRNGESFEKVNGIPDDEANTAAALNRDGTRMVTSAWQSLLVWSLGENGEFTSTPIPRVSLTSSLAMSSDGDSFLLGTTEGTLQWWSSEGSPLTRPLKQSGPVIAVAFAHDQLTAAAATTSLDGSETARVQVWDLPSQETLSPAARFFGSVAADSEEEEGWQQAVHRVSAQVMFSPDVSKVMLHYRQNATTWDLAPNFGNDGIPEKVSDLAKAIGGLQLSPSTGSRKQMDVLSPVPYSALSPLTRQRSEDSPPMRHPSDQVSRWIDWLIAAPDKRHISPTSEMSNEEFSSYLVSQSSLASLQEARIRNPNDLRVGALYLLEKMKANESGERAITPSEAAWFAEKASDFLKSEVNHRMASPDSIPRYAETARMLTLIEGMHPSGSNQLDYYSDALTAFAQALERETDNLDAWSATALVLSRMGDLSWEKNADLQRSDSCQKIAFLIFSLLSKEDQQDVMAPLAQLAEGIIASSQINEQPEEESDFPRENRRGRRDQRFFVIEQAIQDLTAEMLLESLGMIERLPASLKTTLTFFLQRSPQIGDSDLSAALWRQRAFAQSMIRQEDQAIYAADRALELGIEDPASLRRLQKLRATLYSNQGNTALARSAFTAAIGVPPRPEDASPEMIDLSPYFASGLHTMPEVTGRNDRRAPDPPDFAIRPGILLSQQGIAFDVRGIIFSDPGFSPTRPDSSRMVSLQPPPLGIPVGQKATQLNFLHAATFSMRPDSPADPSLLLGEYVIHYEDGSSATIPLRLGIELGSWRPALADGAPDDEEDTQTASPVVAWQGTSATNRPATLYVTNWKNPKPDLKIISFDFVNSGRRNSGAFLVAATATF